MRLGVVILNVLTEVVVVEGKSTYVHSLTFVIYVLYTSGVCPSLCL